jgi:hypothetical protein
MMKIDNFHTLKTKPNLLGSKLILGGLTAVVAATVGTAGIAAAQSTSDDSAMPNVSVCKTQFKQYEFDSTGQCVRWWNQHQGGHGYGYGDEGHHHRHHHKHHHHFHFHNYFSEWWRDLSHHKH